MKRIAVVLALVALGACQKKAEQAPAQAADTSKMMMSDSSHMMVEDTSMHVMKADTSKRMIAPNKPTKKP